MTPSSNTLQAWRAALLHFPEPGQAALEPDGLLLIGPNAQGRQVVQALGPYAALQPALAHDHPSVSVTHFPGRTIAPGFVDMHLHYPQIDVMGAPAPGLLPWLEQHVFPYEARFSDPQYSAEVAHFFVGQLLSHGVTTALAFASAHPASVDALFAAAQQQHMRLITGKCLMDQHVPPGVRDQTEQSLRDTEALIQRWHGVDRLGYAITPRFVPSCSAAQLQGAGELARQYPNVWIQSHLAENPDEVAWVQRLYPQARSYLAVYEQFGLLRPRAVYAHCLHINDDDRARMRSTGTAAAICPSSNLFLGSGFFDYAAADRSGIAYGLGSDVGAGTSLSPFHSMLAAYQVGREGLSKSAMTLRPQQLWWQHTGGAAQALGLGGVVGNLKVGCEADWLLLNPQATPLLARRTAAAHSLDEWLFALIVLGDERVIEKTVLAHDAPVASTQGQMPRISSVPTLSQWNVVS
jgi:guanine deaminase